MQSLEIGIGQRYGIMIERANRSGQHVVRASTRTQQVYQGTAILDYSLTLVSFILFSLISVSFLHRVCNFLPNTTFWAPSEHDILNNACSPNLHDVING